MLPGDGQGGWGDVQPGPTESLSIPSEARIMRWYHWT